MPESLYKYRAVNEFSDRIFLHNEIYFASPKDFNDPFDCKIRSSREGTEKDHKDYIRRQLKMRHGLTGQQLEQTTQELYNAKLHEDPTLQEDAHQRFMKTLEDNLGIFCLSRKNDHILMWSHYADCHRGFCLEFQKEEIFALSLQVNYCKDYPKVNTFRTPKREWVETQLLTKSSDWAYEEEERIIENTGSGIRLFAPQLLSGVIFGCQMRDEDKAHIASLLEGRQSPVQIYEAKIKTDSFGLDIVPFRKRK